jgi:hypothetical protein
LSTKANVARLLKLNYDVVEALAGKSVKDRWLVYTNGIATKLFSHAVSAYQLFVDGTSLNVPELNLSVKFIDWPSIEVLARACTETYIAYRYVYVDPGDNSDLAEFRFHAWMLAGFSKRESFPVIGGEAKAQLESDKKSNARHRRRMQQTATFQGLKKGQQQVALEGMNWHPDKSLSAICEEVFGPTWGRPLYRFMSSHAHSDGLSAVQVQQTQDHKKQEEMAESAR